jgi:hypothetical protein
MKLGVALSAVTVLTGACLLAATFEHPLAHALGIDTQQSQNYDFVSGVGPMLITALGFTGAFLTVVRSLNCHQPGCLRVGRHKVDGTPWCNRHHEQARPRRTDSDRLEEILAELRANRHLN